MCNTNNSDHNEFGPPACSGCDTNQPNEKNQTDGRTTCANEQFASLCESRGVKELVSMDNIALTVFAPIDKSLADLLAKSKSRSINLIDLAKHHIGK
jgi:hypothetical protein